MKKPKILVVSYLFPNNVMHNHGIFVLNRLKAMTNYADIKVINPISNSPVHKYISKYSKRNDISEFEIIDGIDVYHPRFFSVPGHLKSIEVFSYYRAVLKVIRQINWQFDFIDLHWTFPDLPTGYWLARKYNSPLSVTLRGMEAFHFSDTGIRKYVVAYYLKKVSRIISLSKEMALTAKELGCAPKVIKVIRNGVDTSKFFYIGKEKARNMLDIKQDEKIIIGVGGLIYRKGFDIIIKALKKIIANKKLKDCKLYIVGSKGLEGDYSHNLLKLINANGLDRHIVFVGTVANKDLMKWYNAADVFCLASRGEGSPNVLTEALACGTPAVATNVGSVSEIMKSEPNLGRVVDVDDIDKIAIELENILLGEHDQKKQAELFKRYSWDWCAKEVMTIF